ncbi:MAG: carboxylesterase family protein [Gammaproteobacteria bacterium]
MTSSDTNSGDSFTRGRWRGERRNNVECFYGVRYARLAQPRQPRSVAVGISEQLPVYALTEVPVFPQLPSRLEKVLGKNGRHNPHTDDAFYLNVWSPVAADGLPVIVFIHGGAWITGGGAMPWYRGQRLAGDGAVVVSLNYRLGPAGHLAPDDWPNSQEHRPFGDILLALRWVQNNIREFGGDPDRVTLAGQSAGAWYSWALSSLPEAIGMFRQSALFSIPEVSPWTYEQRQEFTRRALGFAAADISNNAPTKLLLAGISALKEMPYELGAIPTMYMPMLTGNHREILATAQTAAETCHVDSVYIRKTPHEMSAFLPWDDNDATRQVDLLDALRSRAADQEIPEFVKPERWSDAYNEAVLLASWMAFGRFATQIATTARDRGISVAERDFVAVSGHPGFGAVHCIDLPFQFGHRNDWHDAPMLEGWGGEEFESLSAALRQDLINFSHEQFDEQRRTFGSEHTSASNLSSR